MTVLAASYPQELRAYLERFATQVGDVRPAPDGVQGRGRPSRRRWRPAFAGADLLVLNSGMTLSYGYYGHEWERYLPRLLAFLKARELGVPYGIYGHSFDRIDPPADILYRDVLGTRRLRLHPRLGVAGPAAGEGRGLPGDGVRPGQHVRLRPAGRPERAPTPTPSCAGTGSRRGRFLAFVPRLDVNRFRDDGREQVHAAQTRDLIASWVRRTGEPVVIVPEVQRLLEAHRTMVYDQLPDDVRPHVRYMADYWMPDEAQAVYARARLVVSAEMHSVILALAAGTPALHPHFAQAGLKQWMLRDLGIEEWLFDQDAVPARRDRRGDGGGARRPPGGPPRVERATAVFRRRQDETMAVVRRAALGHTARTAVRLPGRRRAGRPGRGAGVTQCCLPGPSRRRPAAVRPWSGWRTTSAAAASAPATGCPPSGSSPSCWASAARPCGRPSSSSTRRGSCAAAWAGGCSSRTLRRAGAVGASLDTVLHLEGGTVGHVFEMRHVLGTRPPAWRRRTPPLRPGRAACPAGGDAARLPVPARPAAGRDRASTWRWRAPPTTRCWRR